MNPIVQRLTRSIRRTHRRVSAWNGNRKALARARQGGRVVTDACGFRFVFQPWMRHDARALLERSGTTGQWAAIASLVRPGDTVFDVGAHAGRFSAFVERLIGDRGRIFAFEPVPESFWMLRENLALNRCTRTSAVQSAVGRRAGMITMNLFPPEFSSWNTLGKPVMRTPFGKDLSPSRSEDVPIDTIDAFCQRNGIKHIDFLKVDVEGFECDVFAGATRMLSERRIGRICFEISRQPLKGAGFTARQVFEALEQHGYKIFGHDEQTSRFTGPFHDSDEYWANYYASTEPLVAEARPGAAISRAA